MPDLTVRLEQCGYCRVMFDPAESDAVQRFSFHSEECERLYRPGILHAVDAAPRLGEVCETGFCSTGELPLEDIRTTR